MQIFSTLKHLLMLRMFPGLAIAGLYLALYLSPFYRRMPPDLQLFVTKLFLPVLGVVVAHWLGKALLPTVENWSDRNQQYIKIARIALYVAIPVAIALGG
jgi:hypothetical protein